MFTDPAFTLADQLFWMIDCFRKAMAPEACRRRIGALSLAVWARVHGLERRFAALYAMWKAGTLPPPRPSPASAGEGEGDVWEAAAPPPRPSPARAGEGVDRRAGFDPGACDAATADRARLRPASVLPRAFAWLHRLLPVSAAMMTGGVESLLVNCPETREFVAACPQAGRVLRPLCRMAGVKAPEWLALPKRERVRKSRAPLLSEQDAAELARLTARFPDTPPARAAKRALRRMFVGLPVNLQRMSAVARGYFVHPPRDGNCPPPEIGYGGRWRRPPRDYKPPDDWE